MILQKCLSNVSASHTKPTNISTRVLEDAHFQEQERSNRLAVPADIDLDIREVYFLIMQFLSAGPCQKTFRLFWNELLEHQLLPRRYHAWYSRSGMQCEDKNDDGVSFPLTYEDLIQRYSHIQTDHLVKLLRQLMLIAPAASISTSNRLNAVDVPTLLGTGSFSLLSCDRDEKKQACSLPAYLRWPHMLAGQVHGLSLRAIGGFARHHRAPSVHTASHAIAKPSTMVQKMQNIKKMRGHRNAVYCAIFDRLGRYVITGSDDRLVKIWSMETAFCLASCRGHEGDITDLAVSSNNALVASASNDFVIRVWRLPDGIPISVLQGHTGTVTAIAFNPRTSASTVYQLLSSSDDGTCRIWDARYSQCKPRIYEPRRIDIIPGRNNVSSSSGAQQNNQILCCAFNANGTVFVTGSSDTLARVWSTYKSSSDDSGQPNHEVDVLSGHENDVNYVQFSGCAITPRSSSADALKEENTSKFKNSGLSHDNIVTCSRDGSAIIWIPRSRRYHGKAGRWMKAYHLKVPPPPLPPRPPRGGPRQRILPTPRGVNMIVWSLDNRFVLAAIMDCRICVWNAADGSLVHSLTGHTESTYVLDVHPFNPRIAMSAGYDGKTIIWDIWEGTPVRIFEIGHYKLVDGKFSQDGTSIVLSDDVGQIYLLSTGEGESQKDAKYDQFFLGDYRPLIRDALGNVLDQETQLAPHRRNFQDLLCDSSMVPYTEPYQSMYQRRRLGALGMEWRPSSINFATGPDFSLGEDFPMMPIMEPDAIFDVPEIVDLTFWEPEVEARSDDADSEYNASEEHVSEREHESLSTSPYSDSDSDARDIEAEERQEDSRRRSKRKKAEFTASGRRLKRRNSEGYGSKKVKVVHRGFKKKYRKASASRPKRSAALNAMSALAQFSETDSDGEDMDDFESDSSESESLEVSNNRSVEPAEDVDSMASGGGKRRLVLKLPFRDPRKSLLSGASVQTCGDPNKAGPSSSVWAAEDKSAGSTKSSPVNATDPRPIKSVNKIRFKFKGVPDQVVGGSAAVEEKTNKEGEKAVSSEKLTSGVMLDMPDTHHEVHPGSLGPTNSNAIRDSCVEDLPVSSDITPKTEELPGLIGKDQICDGSLPHDVKVSTRSSTTKLKFTHRGFADKRSHQHNLVAGEDLVGHGECSSARASLAGDCRDREEDIPNGRNFRKYAGIDLPEAETDAVRRSRSTEIKPSSRQPSGGKYKLRLRRTDPSEGTSNGAESPPNRWLSNSQTALNSRSSRSRDSSVHVDEPSPLSISQPNFDIGKISWLMLYDQEPGYRYIPQYGDEVAYMRQGHQEFMETSGSHERGPWVSTKGKLKAVELCVIEGLDYATVPSGESCCKITLRFTDPSSNVLNKTFKLTLPELVNFPDFLVEKSWYDFAVGRNWTAGEKCSVWWRNEGGEGGSWWDGQVLSSKPKSNDFPDSPWERYTVEYRSEASNDTQLHSPWELHDIGCTWEPPHLDFRIRDELRDCIDELETPVTRSQDPSGIQKLNQVSLKSDFMNRFPVPVSPQLIKLRLRRRYYRSLQAVQHDIDVMISNASAYFSSRNPEFVSKMNRLSQHFKRKFSEL